MKICVVGGTGLISISIVRLLLAQGHDVSCFNRGVTPGLPEGARLIQGDRTDEAHFERVMQRERFDAAIDMICFNADQTRSDVRAFRDVGHFIMCSTVCTYGAPYRWLPVTEDHPLRPTLMYGRNKVSADNAFLEAYYRDGFPVTIVKPSSTYGPHGEMGLIRQISGNNSWLDRIRKGKPLIVAGDGLALHQFLHVDDAAVAFAAMLGRERCIGQVYHLVREDFISWVDHHRTAMRVLGREVDLVGVPAEVLAAFDPEQFGGLAELMIYNNVFSNAKLRRDVPEFTPRISLEAGMAEVLEALDREGRIPNSDEEGWEDALIEAQQQVRTRGLASSR